MVEDTLEENAGTVVVEAGTVVVGAGTVVVEAGTVVEVDTVVVEAGTVVVERAAGRLVVQLAKRTASTMQPRVSATRLRTVVFPAKPETQCWSEITCAVHLGAHEHEQTGKPQPEQQDNDRCERAIGLAVTREIRGVQGKES